MNASPSLYNRSIRHTAPASRNAGCAEEAIELACPPSSNCPPPTPQGDLNLRAYGHLRLPVDQYAWQPRLVLEPPDPALAPINATVEPPVEALRFMGGHFLRPFAMRFELPADLEGATCFKVPS